jgi:hypothetical protein
MTAALYFRLIRFCITSIAALRSVAHGQMACKSYNWASTIMLARGARMTDMYVYQFVGPDGSAEQNALSPRSATLEAIKDRGEPLMDSQLVVDHSELDSDGFLLRFGISTNAIDNLWSEIRSLGLRAESRDTEALELNESTEGQRKYMLRLESRVLRDQALKLKAQRIDLLTEKFRSHTETQDFVQFGGALSTE